MTYIIWLDADGEEIKRKVKGRGRGPRGFEKREDGNWYSIAPQVKAEDGSVKPLNAPQTPQDGETDENGVQERPRKRQRIVTAAKQTTLDVLLKSLHPLTAEENDGVMTLESPILCGKSGLVELDEGEGQPIFHRVVIDEGDKSVMVWDITAPDSPCLIVQNAISAGE